MSEAAAAEQEEEGKIVAPRLILQVLESEDFVMVVLALSSMGVLDSEAPWDKGPFRKNRKRLRRWFRQEISKCKMRQRRLVRSFLLP